MSDRPYNIQRCLLEFLSPPALGKRVAEVHIGLSYTGVVLDSGEMGVAYTFPGEFYRGCKCFTNRKPLSGSDALSVLKLLESEVQLERTVALAAANALTDKRSEEFLTGDFLDYVDLRPSDTVGMVGNFAPMVANIRSRVKELLIFEIEHQSSPEIYPAQSAFSMLPGCDAAIITGTAIINDTLDRLLIHCRNCRETVILGASTPLIPEAFADTPVTLLSGIKVVDNSLVLRAINEGGGLRKFRKGIKKLNLRINTLDT
ncbi:MAG: DUF364 domain-containing protein [candidate division Zixibacteria bacterium]|nr:DUF364 domain-containing protein [Candidatus Tariuqbacter arcticus]